MPNLNEKSAVELAEKYIEKYKLHSGELDFKLQEVIFCPSHPYFNGEGIWEVYYDVDGWDDLDHSINISDTEEIVLCVSTVFYPIYLPQEFKIKEKKLSKKEKRLKRKEESHDYTIDSYASSSKYPCIYVDFNEIISDDCVLLSQKSVKLDFWGNPVLLQEGLKIIGYMQDENADGTRDDLIVSGTCMRNTTDNFSYVRWLLKFDGEIYLISDMQKENLNLFI